MNTVTFTKPDGEIVDLEEGCVFDGAFGWHNGPRVYRLARDLGFVPTLVDADDLIERYDSGDPDFDQADWALELISDAEDHLNYFVQAGYAFTWDDGFYLWSVDDAI